MNQVAQNVYNGTWDMVSAIYGAMTQLVMDVFHAIPLLVTAFVIWLIGGWLIDLAVSAMRRVDIKGTRMDDKVMNVLIPIVRYAGKFFLVLIVMDYLGIGSTVIGSILNALSFGVAIAMGMAFGKAFETDAKDLYTTMRRKIMK